MDELEELKQCYSDYLETVKDVLAKSHPLAGVFGFGSGPKSDSCHRAFYSKAGDIVQRIAAASPSPEDAAAAVDWILRAPEVYSSLEMAVWMLTAAQGHALTLISFLSPADAAKLADWYQVRLPRRKRLPVQEQVFQALKKRGRDKG